MVRKTTDKTKRRTLREIQKAIKPTSETPKIKRLKTEEGETAAEGDEWNEKEKRKEIEQTPARR
jgi:hypothetical protein